MSAPGKFGIYASFALVTVSIFVSLLVQHYFAEGIDLSSWTDYCSDQYEDECKANSAVYRISFGLVIFFVTQLTGTLISTSYFDRFWGVKCISYALLIVAFYFTPGDVFDTNGYAWFARLAGAAFIVLQQVILLDMAYSWNETWVSYSNEAASNFWLGGLMAVSCVIFCASISVIGVLYWQFSGCPENEAIISLTLVLGTGATLFQLFTPGQGSLLTSAIMFAYATFLCYSAVVLNPDHGCNPTLATSYQTVTEVIGIIITFASLVYTAASASKYLSEHMLFRI